MRSGFQSHLGLISTLRSNFFLSSTVLFFQSHLGLISTQDRADRISKTINFQSHLGLISTHTRGLHTQMTFFLSIPSWSDFNKRRIRPDSRQKWYFQSHLGLISTKIGRNRYRRHPCLSIPSWSDFNMFICSYLTLLRKTFNPILVWFQLDIYSADGEVVVGVDSFNPILVWFQQLMCKQLRAYTFLLSIPSWSDFNKNKSDLFAIPSGSFQSHLGLISTRKLFFFR